MANQFKFWTAEEDAVLVKYARECKTFTEAYKKTAEETGRTPGAVLQHHILLRKKEAKHVLLLSNRSVRKTLLSKFIMSVKSLFIQ